MSLDIKYGIRENKFQNDITLNRSQNQNSKIEEEIEEEKNSSQNSIYSKEMKNHLEIIKKMKGVDMIIEILQTNWKKHQKLSQTPQWKN